MDNKNVGQRIKSIRLRLGKTMEEFGSYFSTSKVTVFNWEKGRNLPNKNNLKLIAEISDITVDELLYGKSTDSIGQLIKNERKSLNMTQEGFAKHINIEGMSSDYINDVENNIKTPSYETLNKIASKLNKQLSIQFN